MARSGFSLAIVVSILTWGCPTAQAEPVGRERHGTQVSEPDLLDGRGNGTILERGPAAEDSKPSVSAEYRSPSTAGALSILSTVGAVALGAGLMRLAHSGDPLNKAGIAFVGAGLIVGPSMGHIYAGEYGHAALTSILRPASAVGGLALVLSSVVLGDCTDGGPGACDPPGLGNFGVGLGIAMMLVAPALVMYDFFDAPGAAQRSNRRYGLTDVALVPVAIADGPSTTSGLALVGRF